MSEIAKKVVLITGASAGIGAAVAVEAAGRGHDLCLTARRGDRLAEVAERCVEKNPDCRVHPITGDLEDPASPERIVAEALASFGQLDVLVNNAGFGLPTLFADGDPDLIRRQIEVNFVAPLMLARHAMPALLESGGTVINIGSAITCVPNPALGAYGATKAGIAYWNDALRRELRHKGVNVCLVEPGPIKTEFFNALMSKSERPGGYHPMLDAPSDWMSGDVREAARRIVRLVTRPRRRLSVMKRFVWPWRTLGALFRASPALGDMGVTYILRHHEKKGPRRAEGAGSVPHASPVD